MVDEGIVAIPKCVSDVENIGFCKKNGDVAVGVSRSVVLEGNRRPVELYREVALASGFADQHHLARVFRRITGTTPSSYRRSL
jgi:hypothetical protein